MNLQDMHMYKNYIMTNFKKYMDFLFIRKNLIKIQSFIDP